MTRVWPRSHSLGYLYDAACRFVGFGPLQAGKLMGLSAYGRANGAEPWELLPDALPRTPAAVDDGDGFNKYIHAWTAELDRLAGDLHALYGMANLDGLSPKRQRVLPAKCRVYDLLNFASEIATHRATQDGRMRLQAYIGTLVSDEYDLEGTAEKVPEFKDLFLNLN